MSLRRRFERHLELLDLPEGPALLAVSGGPDSLALLDLMVQPRPGPNLTFYVAHLDHGINPESARVAREVQAVAKRYGVGFRSACLGLGPSASETKARIARYNWLHRQADQLGAELIVTAHHRDDQVETVLMRALNGSGPAGLAGMASRAGRLVRPLLPFRRAELEEHVTSVGLAPWHDPANLDPRHLRVWIRTELLPVLRSRIPDIDRRLLMVAHQARAERTAWDRFIERAPDLELRSECDGVSVAASPLGRYDSGAVRAMLGALGRRAGCLVGPMRAARMERLLAGGRSGAVAQLGQGCAAELAFGRLRLFREASSAEGDPGSAWAPCPIEGDSGNLQAGVWHLSWRGEMAPERLERSSPSSWFPPGEYLVRRWRPGDRLRPLGGTGRRRVVRCMQDARIARHERASWPVIETGGAIVWVPGVCRSADHLPGAGAPALRIDADRS